MNNSKTTSLLIFIWCKQSSHTNDKKKRKGSAGIFTTKIHMAKIRHTNQSINYTSLSQNKGNLFIVLLI